MAEIPAALVKRLREQTGAGMMDCKKALSETANGTVEEDAWIAKATDWLRAKGIARAAAQAGRSTNEGVIESYVHSVGGVAKTGVLIEVDCETDFVAKSDGFRKLAKELCLQVAGANPRWVRREDVPADIVDREKSVYREQVAGKPENIVEKILSGKLDAFYKQHCLLDQAWIKDDKQSIGELVMHTAGRLKENITVARFARFQVGEAAGDGDGAEAPSPN